MQTVNTIAEAAYKAAQGGQAQTENAQEQSSSDNSSNGGSDDDVIDAEYTKE